MKPRNPPYRSRGCRWLRLGWLLAAVALLAWPAALWHEATTLHRVCPEHGERLDVAAADTHGVAERSGVPEGERFDAGGGEGHHEQCPFVLLGQPTSATTHEPCWRVVPVEARVGGAEGAERALGTVPLLALAPKHSPPVELVRIAVAG